MAESEVAVGELKCPYCKRIALGVITKEEVAAHEHGCYADSTRLGEDDVAVYCLGCQRIASLSPNGLITRIGPQVSLVESIL